MNSSMENHNDVSEMQSNLELLKQTSRFDTLPPRPLKLLAYLAIREHFSPEEMVFEAGDNHSRAYLVISGSLQLLRHHQPTPFTVATYQPGDLLGLFSLFYDMPALFSLQATTQTEVLSIGKEQFAKILDQFPETGKLILKALHKQLYEWERRNLSEAHDCCLSRAGATAL